jgi:1-acyl-sn-glycerol-3-phosphate acyltransferase
MLEKIKYSFKDYVAGRLPEKKYDLTLTNEAMDKVDNIEKILEEDSKLNYIIYFNHISFADPLFAGHISLLIDPKNTRKLIAPVSYSHTEMKLKNSGTWAMKEIIEMCGVEVHRVIQKYQIGNDYSPNEALAINRVYLNRLRELKRKGISTGLLISPEGHRSDSGSLEKGEEGLVLSGRVLAPTLYIPVGIAYGEEYNRSGMNFNKKIIVNIGETSMQKSKEKRKDVFNILMTNLAKTLPIEMRGYYGESIKVSENLAEIPKIRK